MDVFRKFNTLGRMKGCIVDHDDFELLGLLFGQFPQVVGENFLVDRWYLPSIATAVDGGVSPIQIGIVKAMLKGNDWLYPLCGNTTAQVGFQPEARFVLEIQVDRWVLLRVNACFYVIELLWELFKNTVAASSSFCTWLLRPRFTLLPKCLIRY